jgi:hypothetical protein
MPFEEATVNTNSFSVDQGSYAAAQVNYFTKSGTNACSMATPTRYGMARCSTLRTTSFMRTIRQDSIASKPRSTVNEFGVSVGGPIRSGKLFFFAHYEGIRIALPLVSQITLPTPGLSAIRIGTTRNGWGTDPITGTLLPAQPAEIPFYQKMFSLLPASPGGSPVPIVGCPLGTNSDGCASQRQASLNNSDSENLIVAKIDHTIDAKDSVWYRFQQDTGLQAAYTDPINLVLQLLFTSAPAHSLRGLHACLQPNLWSISSILGELVLPASSSRTTTLRCSQTFPIVLESGRR